MIIYFLWSIFFFRILNHKVLLQFGNWKKKKLFNDILGKILSFAYSILLRREVLSKEVYDKFEMREFPYLLFFLFACEFSYIFVYRQCYDIFCASRMKYVGCSFHPCFPIFPCFTGIEVHNV